MKGIDTYLIHSEIAVVTTRRHWMSVAQTAGICAAVALLGVLVLIFLPAVQFLSVTGVVLILGALGWWLWTYVSWRDETLLITDKRVLLLSGLLTQRVAIMPLSKVTDLTYERTVAGRILGYGAFVIESAGQHQAFSRIDYLPRPDELYQKVSTLLFGSRPSPVSGSWGGDQPTTWLGLDDD